MMFDDGYWPAFTSGKARSTHAAWDQVRFLLSLGHSLTDQQVGEGFVKELDFSRIWLRINANDSANDKDDIVAEFKCDTKDFLEQCFVCHLFFSYGSRRFEHLNIDIYIERILMNRTNLPISNYPRRTEVIDPSSE